MTGLLVAGAVVGLALLAWSIFRRRVRRAPRAVGIPAAVPRRYTKHARARMIERRITKDQVEATLASPDRRNFDADENSYRFEKDYPNLVVKVWVVAEPWPPSAEVVIKTTASIHFDHREIPPTERARLIGRSGRTINQIQSASGARVRIDDANVVRVCADSRQQVEHAWQLIDGIVNGPRLEVGTIVLGSVAKITSTGAVIAIPNHEEGYLPIAMMRPLVGGRRLNSVSDALQMGQTLSVIVEETRDGRIRLALPTRDA